ncbi:MFS transporter [Paraburkholderia graminis]|nr:MFS transporter [Paraburkholderia graminis]
MPMLMLLYIVAFIDRSNVGFAKLSFLHDLGLSESVFGIGAGIFYAGYMLFEVPSNLLLARIGARRTFLRIMLLWAVCSAGLAAMTGQNSYYLWRFLLGASEAGLFPGILFYLTYWVPISRRARFTALFMGFDSDCRCDRQPGVGPHHAYDARRARPAELALAVSDRRTSAARADVLRRADAA